MGELPVLSLRTRGSTRNCLHVCLSRRSGRLSSIAVTVQPHNSLLPSIERDWTKLPLSTHTLMVDSLVAALSQQGIAFGLLVAWLSRLTLMPGSHLMVMRIECILWMRRGPAPCKIEYSHPTSLFLRKDPRVHSWSHSM